MTFRIIQGDNRDVLKTIESNTIDAIVTDPPYGIDFLGKEWDANTGALETYQECLRVLKPGGHILAFSAARTYHHLAVTLEQAGFEIRDQIMWIYSSGFPKSQDIGKQFDRKAGKKNNLKRHDSEKKDNNAYDVGSGVKCPKCNKDSAARYDCKEGNECGMVYKPQTPEAKQWLGWGTALKPAHEPIALARKPMKTSIAQNCQKYGTGALNIDASRIPIDGVDTRSGGSNGWDRVEFGEAEPNKYDGENYQPNDQGRFPSNVLGEIPDYQKYFYCPKVSRKERHIGFDTSNIPTDSSGYQGTSNGGNYLVKKQKTNLITNDEMLAKMGGHFIDENGNKKVNQEGSNMLWLPHTGNIYVHGLKHEYEKWCKANNIPAGNVGNNHPTVKPVELMKYLIKLITPPGGIVLDPFNGSGSTGMAAVELGYEYIGIELDPNYAAIAEIRIKTWTEQHLAKNNYGELFEE